MLHPIQSEPRGLEKMRNPRRKFMTPIYVGMIVFVSWILYFVVFKSPVLEALQRQPSFGKHLYGSGQGGQIAPVSSSNMKQVFALPAEHLPEVGKSRAPGKLVVVGDVHGMLQELRELLDKVRFEEESDHLILAGDIINKGPDSTGVIDLAINMEATVVRGNHEDRIIHARASMRAKDDFQLHGDDNIERRKSTSEEDHFTNRDLKDRKLAKQLGEQRIDWLEKCPVILTLGDLGEMGQLIVVHAGLEPGVNLPDQHPYMNMNMRTISADGVPSEEHQGDGWAKAWNTYQRNLPKGQRTTVIYGHDSKRGLQIEEYSMGIDTGCVKGGQLSAVVIEGGDSEYTSKLVHVDCHNGR